MRHTDILIVGGGLAGSAAAAMLGRAGIATVAIDPHSVYPPDFRCEKLDGSQVRLLHKTGLADAVLRVSTPIRGLWVARHGGLVQKRRNDQFGIYYDQLVNVIRGEIAGSAQLLCGKVEAIQTSSDVQRVRLAGGEEISARLVVLASGLNNALRSSLGIKRHDVSICHSVSIAFDMKPVGRAAFDFPALTYYPKSARDRIAYLTLFPIGVAMRANLFVYHDCRDPWLRALREAPHATLYNALPGLKRLMPDFELVGEVKVRPVDLYVTSGFEQPGLVLVGDCFATSCPAAGTGANKVFTDVERLCHVHIPRWLQTSGMGVDKISEFYVDPVKRASDLFSAEKARRLRSLSIDMGLSWRILRLGKFAAALVAATMGAAKDRTVLKSLNGGTTESAKP